MFKKSPQRKLVRLLKKAIKMYPERITRSSGWDGDDYRFTCELNEQNITLKLNTENIGTLNGVRLSDWNDWVLTRCCVRNYKRNKKSQRRNEFETLWKNVNIT